LPAPDEIGELVEHFILDDRRFHIGDEEALAPICGRLNQNIDFGIADHGARGRLGERRAGRIENKIAGIVRQPGWLARNSGRAGDCACQAGQVLPAAGASDQGEDNRHGSSSYSGGRPGHKQARDSAPPVLVIAGPTASGKSALALELADRYGGTIINADSLQIYRDLPILTARPDQAAQARIPHRLYGFLDAGERGSAARWRALALDEIAAAAGAGRLPILVGGTGLYLRAIEEGLAPVPDIPAEIRQEAIELHRALGGIAFRERLASLDPAAAQRLSPGDTQRLVRAFEVVRATGVAIGIWQQQPQSEPAYRFGTILLAPPRDRLYASCNARLVRMIEAGALAEAKALAARRLDPGLPAMKAVGLPELLAYLRGDVAFDVAIAAAQRSTRRYAKRQMTWFRHQITPDVILAAQFSESLLRCSRHFIDHFLLTRPV
jgi:tRNA dimethylallyltransferase